MLYGNIKMKRGYALLFLLLCSYMAFAQNDNDQLIQRWDIGLASGPVFYSDQVGFTGMIETRLYFSGKNSVLRPFAGAGGAYQYTKNPLHTLNQGFGYALAGADCFFLRKYSASFSSLSLRMQLSGGGGYMSDINTEGAERRCAAFIVQPSAGFDYGIKRIHISLLGGYQIISVGSVLATAVTASFGVAYSMMDKGR